MTKRSIMLGSIFSLGIGLVLPVTEFWIQGTRLGLSSATPAAFFILFLILIGPQFLLKSLYPNWALTADELLVIFAMMMVATVIPTRGFGGPLFSMTTGVTYYATPENEWANLIRPHLSYLAVVTNAEAIKQMYEGLEGGQILWWAWARPLIWWTAFLICMATTVISVMLLFRRTWIERERLVFPVAQVALAMVEEGPTGSKLNPLLRNPIFWIGFLIPAILESLNALNRYMPELPAFQIRWQIQHQIPFVPSPTIRLNFLMVGFAFFVESRLAFSLWFFYLLSLPTYWIYGTFLHDYHGDLGPWTASGSAGAVFAHQQMGSMLVLVVTLVWAARTEFWREKYALVTCLSSAGIMCIMVWSTGVPAWVTPIVIGSAIVIWLSLTRLMAQAGIATIVPAMVPLGFTISMVGTTKLGIVGLINMGLTLIWAGDLLTYLMGPVANSFYVGHRSKIKPLAGSLSLLVSVVLSFIGSVIITIYLTLKVGGLNLHPQYFQSFPRAPWQFVGTKMLHPVGGSVMGYVWMSVGAAMMLLLTYLSRLFYWFPLHPLGFLAQGGWIMHQLWFSFFLAWSIKMAVLWIGGGGLKKAKVLFTGIIVGLLVIGGIWLIIDAITGMRGNRISVY